MNLIAEQENLEKLGRRIQAMREMRQMSALKLAAELESSLTSVRDWEMGSRKLQPATIRRLAETLSISPRTADSLWAYARAWLFEEIRKTQA